MSHRSLCAVFPGQILLELNDANTVFRDKLIGSFTLDAGFVYRSPAHFVSAWVALVSPTAAVIQGYLKVRHRCCAWVPAFPRRVAPVAAMPCPVYLRVGPPGCWVACAGCPVINERSCGVGADLLVGMLSSMLSSPHPAHAATHQVAVAVLGPGDAPPSNLGEGETEEGSGDDLQGKRKG